MSDALLTKPAAVPNQPASGAGHTPVAMLYLGDGDSTNVIRQALADLGVFEIEATTGNLDTAIADLSHRRSPRFLAVDISGFEDPVGRLAQLADVCEPGTRVIVVGETNDIALYRQMQAMGVAEYFFKPLVSSLVARTCESILTGRTGQPAQQLGKLVFVMSLGGGAGATTVAVNTAWHLAAKLQRRVMLLDLHMNSGDAALQLNVAPTGSLREALEHPERIDDLFLERAVIRVTERLSVMATLQPFSEFFAPDEKVIAVILQRLLNRHRYVIVDLPAWLARRMPGPIHLPGTYVLVSNATLVAARDVPRWREQIGPNTPDRAVLHVLNKFGAHGGLPLPDFTHAAGQPPDMIIPYDRRLGDASALGIAAMQDCRTFQRALSPLLRRLSGQQDDRAPSWLRRILGRS